MRASWRDEVSQAAQEFEGFGQELRATIKPGSFKTIRDLVIVAPRQTEEHKGRTQPIIYDDKILTNDYFAMTTSSPPWVIGARMDVVSLGKTLSERTVR